jgi:hypothetical protein
MNPDTPFSTLALRELKAAAAVTAQPIQVVETRSADRVLTGVEAAAKAGAEYSSANRRARHNDSAADRVWKQSVSRGGRIDLVRRRPTAYVPSRR